MACTILLAAVGAGCTQDPALLQPSTTGALAIESFVGNLTQNGSRFYSFSVPRTGKVSVTLLSLTIAGAPSDLSTTLSLGQPSGTACRATTSAPATAGLAPQLTSDVIQTVYCVAISDNGTLTAAADFVVNIARPR